MRHVGNKSCTLVGTSFLPATPYYIYGSAEVGTGRPATAQRTGCGADKAADFMRHVGNKSCTLVGSSFLPSTPYYIYRCAEVGTLVGASLLPSQSTLHTVAGGGFPPFGTEACRSRKSGLTRGDYAAHGRSKISSRVEISFLPCGNFFPPVWRFLSFRMEIFLLPCGNFPPPVWKFSSSRMEISFLPCGNFAPTVWKFLSSRVEIFFLPCGNFLPPVRKFSSSRVEIFLLPYGSFLPPVWKFSSSRVEIFLLPYGNFYAPKRA